MLLFTPGPTPVPESLRQAMALPTIHHRTKEFEAIFAKAREELKALLGLPEVLMLASSGSGAMEAGVLSLCKSKLLSINCGKFGERWGKIAKAHKIPNTEITHQWDTPANVDEVLEALKSDSQIDAVAIQICESAGGLRHPVENIAKAIKSFNPNIIVIADAITAMGVEPIDTTHIDALIGGSQKAFMLPPGMSIIGLSQYAIDIIEERNVGLYFNLATELKNQRKNTTAWTAPTTIIIGLVAFFDLVAKNGGIQNLYVHTKKLSIATQSALESLGLRIYPKEKALAMTTIYDEANAANIRSTLKTFDVNVAAGQDHLKEKIFRINHMGIIPIYEATWVVNAVELSLDVLHIRAFDGSANKVFLDSYYKS
ncbi:pyridoxal-phosphate-dependent aminotransferase family protein [Helicobacter fennelliae]|uniref:Phosphoserine aminotransferase n=1 Tax=Helicobacter fennelliae MRY12-0050 TaxID=1325130 RepID=T1DVD4_9HELI|nr:alanine--glyoxylate aminotransferase family protein [Helicobacter fennelliae]GAD18658.1 phosphoserine aminotransferase [Helicobacter fennelliae MRY12-0050]STP07164.1 aminotransferase [Helicobacter fennelliae]